MYNRVVRLMAKGCTANEVSPDISLSIEMFVHSPGLSFADNCLVLVISSFADRKFCRTNLHVSLRAVAFHATLLRTIALPVTGFELEFKPGIERVLFRSCRYR